MLEAVLLAQSARNSRCRVAGMWRSMRVR